MKKRTVKKAVAAFISLSIMCSLVFTADAHSSNLHGVVAGSEAIGWSISEGNHMASSSFTYKLDITMPSSSPSIIQSRINATVEGACSWYGVADISPATSSIGTVTVSTDLDSTIVAKASRTADASNGHTFSWTIRMNNNHTITRQVMAHEFGHIIGLNDLKNSSNKNKIMYYQTDGTAVEPHSSDIKGAKVINGKHSSHSFSYKYYDTSSSGKRHIGTCSTCKGIQVLASYCTYGGGTKCTVCGTAK